MKIKHNAWCQKAAIFATTVIGSLMGLGLQYLIMSLSERNVGYWHVYQPTVVLFLGLIVGCPLLFQHLVRRFQTIWNNNNAMFVTSTQH